VISAAWFLGLIRRAFSATVIRFSTVLLAVDLPLPPPNRSKMPPEVPLPIPAPMRPAAIRKARPT